MSENFVRVNAIAINPEDAKKVLATLKKLVQFGRALALVTSTNLDDQVMETLTKVLNLAEPLIEDGTAIELINFVLNLLNKPNLSAELKKLQ